MKFILGVLCLGALLCAIEAADARGGGGGHVGSQPANTSAQPVHGPGSSHNPIVRRPKHGRGSSHNPILATKPVVRDHRPGHYPTLGPNRGRDPSPPGGVTVTNGNGQVVPTHLIPNPYSKPSHGGRQHPIVHDHR
ncbi:MAG: hypothetical protein JO000_07165 [Alphaproteobacteria bacterium]|nr:hypothetical protein [Alphaproteobacteria bacterium]